MNKVLTILSNSPPTSIALNTSKIATFLGVRSRIISVDRLSSMSSLFLDSLSNESKIIISEPNNFSLICKNNDFIDNFRNQLFEGISALFIQGFQRSNEDIKLLEYLTNKEVNGIFEETGINSTYLVNQGHAYFSRSLSGMTFKVPRLNNNCSFLINETFENANTYIFVNGRPYFFEKLFGNCRLFLSGSRDVIDIDSEMPKNSSIAEVFPSFAPVMLFMKNIFGDYCWNYNNKWAALIIDDPVLRKRYGFLDFKNHLHMMDEHGFSTSIAFIPWNYKRSKKGTLKIFEKRPDKYSLCVHGCEHTASEFGTTNMYELENRVKLALRRMEEHKKSTGVDYDKVFVFPQGFFSAQAMTVLKANGFVGASNSTFFSADKNQTSLLFRDVMDMAVMSYNCFPLFSRRYPLNISDFALDLFLGKPLLIVEHHDCFKRGYEEIINFMHKINLLESNIRWSSLEDIFMNTYKRRKIDQSTWQIQFYARKVCLRNSSDKSIRFHLSKQESNFPVIKKITCNGQKLNFEIWNHQLQFKIECPPKSDIDINIEYEQPFTGYSVEFTQSQKVKAFLRRHLSEIRDNYLSKNDGILKIATRFKNKMF